MGRAESIKRQAKVGADKDKRTPRLQSLVRSVHMVLTSSSTGAVLERYRFDVDFILRDVPVRDRDFRCVCVRRGRALGPKQSPSGP